MYRIILLIISFPFLPAEGLLQFFPDRTLVTITFKADKITSYFDGRNKRSVWTIPTQAYSEAHFATFPEKLVEPCIKAGTSEKGCCPECGTGWVRIVEENPEYRAIANTNKGWSHAQTEDSTCRQKKDHPSTLPWKTKTIGWQPQCKCGKEPIPCTVLDPFGGSGTVGLVAYKLRRKYILIELNPDYCKIAEQRIQAEKDKYSLLE